MQTCFSVKHKVFILSESENVCIAILMNSSSSDKNHTSVETDNLLFC